MTQQQKTELANGFGDLIAENLKEILDKVNLSPEDLFDREVLEKWAADQGYTLPEETK